MSRLANRLLLAAMLGLYGVVTLSGPALHALPGLGHAAAKLGLRDEASTGLAERETGTAHDCPICHFHAQGQLVDNPHDGPRVELFRIHLTVDPPLIHSPALHRPSSPRAPPIG